MDFYNNGLPVISSFVDSKEANLDIMPDLLQKW